MKKRNQKLNQSGFGMAEWMIILLIILALVAVGWYVAKSKKSTPAKANSAQQTQTPAAKPAEKPAAKPLPAAKKYLEIKELGIKIELNTSTDDAYYIMKNGYAYLSTTSLKAADAECAADKTGVVAIGKYTKTDVEEMSGKTYAELATASGKVIGNDAFWMNRSQANCSQVPATQIKQQAAWDDFKAQASTIQTL